MTWKDLKDIGKKASPQYRGKLWQDSSWGLAREPLWSILGKFGRGWELQGDQMKKSLRDPTGGHSMDTQDLSHPLSTAEGFLHWLVWKCHSDGAAQGAVSLLITENV